MSEYSNINGLKIAVDKCSVLHLGGNRNPNSNYSLLNTLIPKTPKGESVRDLGIYFTHNLKWDSHIDVITKKARRVSFSLLKSLKTKDSSLLVNLFKIYVRPILEFGSNVFNPYLSKDVKAVEKIQSDYLKMVYFRSKHINTNKSEFESPPPYTELLATFKLESLEHRRLKSDLNLFHRYLYGLIPIKHNNSFTIQQSITRGERFKIFSTNATTNVRFNSFFVKTSRIYSKLPHHITNSIPNHFSHHINKFDLSLYLTWFD